MAGCGPTDALGNEQYPDTGRYKSRPVCHAGTDAVQPRAMGAGPAAELAAVGHVAAAVPAVATTLWS